MTHFCHSYPLLEKCCYCLQDVLYTNFMGYCNICYDQILHNEYKEYK